MFLFLSGAYAFCASGNMRRPHRCYLVNSDFVESSVKAHHCLAVVRLSLSIIFSEGTPLFDGGG